MWNNIPRMAQSDHVDFHDAQTTTWCERIHSNNQVKETQRCDSWFS